MKKCLSISALLLTLVVVWAGESVAQTKKEITFSGTHYWSSTGKVFPVGSGTLIMHMELMGVRVNDSADGLFNGASVHIVTAAYRSKGYSGFRGYETWIDEDGDKLIWELMDTPPGAATSPARVIEGTGKYVGWQGTLEYTLQFPKAFPEGTSRGICRETVKLISPQ
jgi:hypothetical protein